MKKNYSIPAIRLIRFNAACILAASEAEVIFDNGSHTSNAYSRRFTNADLDDADLDNEDLD